MIPWSVFSVIAILSMSAASEGVRERKVIDLGDLEVVGELRRPSLFVVESGKGLDPLLRKQAKRQWIELEQELTLGMRKEDGQ